MPRIGATSFAFPDFHGTTRRLVLVNLTAYFVLALAELALPELTREFVNWLVFYPNLFLHGAIWQPITYSLIHPTAAILGTVFELLSLWFLAGLLESLHGDSWVMSLYGFSVLGTALAATVIYAGSTVIGYSHVVAPLYGCFGGIFGLLVAIGILHGDMQFMLFPLPIGIKARYLAVIYGLIAIAMLFGDQSFYAFSQLGGALAAWLYIRMAPRRGVSFVMSERWYGLRNRYYRWKRKRAARKFEVYMRSQGKTVRFDGNGRQIDEDHNDKTRWN
jgi:membrane associated rhomboid family serine protease